MIGRNGRAFDGIYCSKVKAPDGGIVGTEWGSGSYSHFGAEIGFEELSELAVASVNDVPTQTGAMTFSVVDQPCALAGQIAVIPRSAFNNRRHANPFSGCLRRGRPA